MDENVQILIVAGEDSGDSHGAGLVSALRSHSSAKPVSFFGAAGRRMRAEGVEAIVDSDDFGIVGVPEVIKAVPMFLKVMRRITEEAARRKPDFAILVDFPEFNLKLAKKLNKLGIPVVYYISPQLWAWRKYRVKGVKKYIDLMLTILPFEKDWYLEQGVENVEFVGNPLAGKVVPSARRDELRAHFCVASDKNLIALLPGSRAKEIERILPVMLATADLFTDSDKKTRFVIALADERRISLVQQKISEAIDPVAEQPAIITGQTYDVLHAADAAVVTSGTATLETAIIGTPQVIVYKSSSINNTLLRPLISVDTFGLANLIAGRKVYKELIQNDLTVRSLFLEVSRILDAKTNKLLRAEAANIKQKLGGEDSLKRAAEAIVRFANW